MNLNQLQHAFYQAISQQGDGSVLSPHLLSHPNLSVNQQLAIYRRNKNTALCNTLSAHYPVCLRLVGDEFFNAMAKIYIEQTPSHFTDLNKYGSNFSLFIKDFQPTQDLPYLPDVARLEWAWVQAFYGQDMMARLDADLIAAMDNEQVEKVVFQLPVNANLLSSSYPIAKIWQVNQLDYEGEQQIDLTQNEVLLLVWRDGWRVAIEPLTQVQWQLLQVFAQGLPLEAVCHHAIAQNIDVSEYLADFIARGWLASFEGS
ncbi:MAG: DNA-binding domain-containing protein [Gammaproteobacteria bacterium]